MAHRKRPLRAGWYNTTIVEAKFVSKKRPTNIEFVFCVDTGDNAWQSVKTKIHPESALFEDFLDGIKYIPQQEPHEHLFPYEFVGIRCRVSVQRVVEDGVIRNVAVGWELPIGKADYDVTKQPTDEKYFSESKGRDLPI